MGTGFTSQPATRDSERRHRALLHFQFYGGAWSVHFLEDDRRTPIGKKRYIRFASEEELRAFVHQCNPEQSAEQQAIEEFNRDLRTSGHGSLFVNLTEEQYAELRQR